LKIALVILHADPARGGAERYTFDLAQALARRGHAVKLIASTLGPRPAGVECVELATHSLTRLGKYRQFLEAVDFQIDAYKQDVVHAMLPVRRCDVYHPHAGLAAEAVASGHLKHRGLLKRSLAQVANRLNRKRNTFAWVERELLRDRRGEGWGRIEHSQPVVLCLSEYVKATVRRHFPELPESRLATLFNAVDLTKYDPGARPQAREEARRRLGLDHNRVVALMIAQDFERKGLAEAIAGVAASKDERLSLVVVGKQEPGAFRELARRAGVAGRVIFAGPTTDPYAFYAAAEFFVLPTRHDPCSLVVLEALAMGLPVISTKQNGACEIMTPGEHGFVLENADDARGLAAAMRALLDPAARARTRANCLTLRPRLAYDAHMDALLRVYNSIIAASGNS
jgi:UDP-glucose:(heptosyl)LPS alpha-1,3-glucosyltransferase